MKTLMNKHAREAQGFHLINPHVMDKIVQLCRQLQANGHRRWSINGLFEVIRWKHGMKIGVISKFELNNNYRAWYARTIMDSNPELKGFFELRETK